MAVYDSNVTSGNDFAGIRAGPVANWNRAPQHPVTRNAGRAGPDPV